jgi:hypothetical protein
MACVDARLRDKPVPAVSVAMIERDHFAGLGAVKGSDIAFMDQK